MPTQNPQYKWKKSIQIYYTDTFNMIFYAGDSIMRRTCWHDSNANKGDSTLLALAIEFCFTIVFAA